MEKSSVNRKIGKTVRDAVQVEVPENLQDAVLVDTLRAFLGPLHQTAADLVADGMGVVLLDLFHHHVSSVCTSPTRQAVD